MKKRKLIFSVLILALILPFVSFQRANEKVVVSGIVMHTGVFCGGVDLGDDELAEIAKARPFPDQKLYVKKGKINELKSKPVLEFVSGADGKFSFSLPPGEYCIVNALKKDRTYYDKVLKQYKVKTTDYSAVNKDCLTKWFNTPDVILIVPGSGLKDFVITYADRCPWNSIPCVEFDGSPPP